MADYTTHVSCKITDDASDWIDDQTEIRDTTRSDVIRRSLAVAREAGLDYDVDGAGEEISRADLDRAREERDQAQLRADRAERRAADRAQKIDRLQRELEQKDAEIDSLLERQQRLDELGDRLEQFDERMAALDGTLSAQVNEFGSIQQDIQELEASVSRVQTRVEQKLGERDREWAKALSETASTLEDLEQQVDRVAADLKDDGGGFF